MVTSKSFIGWYFVCGAIPTREQPWCQTLETSSDGLNPRESRHLRKAGPDYDGVKGSGELSELSDSKPRLYGELIETCINDPKLP
jgi:hypothetical protein